MTTDVTRRTFLVSSLSTGFALAVSPVSADVITTDSTGLVAGEVKIPVATGELPAYRAMPEGKGPFPFVLVVQEIFGVHEHIKDLCRRLAKAGYMAVAPELYARQGDVSKLSGFDEIRKVVAKVPDDQVMSDLDASAAWAKKNGKVVWGACKGEVGRYNTETGQEKHYWVYPQNRYGHDPDEIKYRFPRQTVVYVSPHDERVIYQASHVLHRSMDEGISWDIISPDLTAKEPQYQIASGNPITRDVTGEEVYSTIYAMIESRLERGVLWTGGTGICDGFTTDHSRIRVTLSVFQDSMLHIRDDSRAVISQNGVLGDQIIQISVGRGQPIEADGRIQTTPSMTETIDAVGGACASVQSENAFTPVAEAKLAAVSTPPDH